MEALAEECALSHARISQLEGSDDPPPPKTIRRIATALFTGQAEDYQAFEMRFIRAAFVPEEASRETIYEPIVEDLQVASQKGMLDKEAVRQIRLQIKLQMDESLRRRGALED